MKVEHFGQQIEVSSDERKACAVENAIVKTLKKHHAMRQRDLWYRAAVGSRVDRETYERCLDRLVERGVIVRETTNRVDSFVIRLASAKKPKPVEPQAPLPPLTPEAA